MAVQLYLVSHRTLWEIHIKTILSGTSNSIKTKLWWNSHWMVLFQNGVRQLRSPAKMAATVQLRCYWKQLWSRWSIIGSWEPLVCLIKWVHSILSFVNLCLTPYIMSLKTLNKFLYLDLQLKFLLFVSDLQKYDLLIFKSCNFLWGMTLISPKIQ
jgi:hypothetical protein